MASTGNRFSFQKLWRYQFFTMVSLLLGIIFTVNPGIVSKACMAVGSALAVIGAILIVVYFVKSERPRTLLVSGVVLILVGGFLALVTTLLQFLIPIFFGMWLIVTSLDNISQGWMARGYSRRWWVGFLLGLICCGLGIFVITRPVQAMEATIRIIGIVMIVSACLQLLSVPFERKPHSAQNVIETTIED